MPTIGEMEQDRKKAGFPEGIYVCYRKGICVQCHEEMQKGDGYVQLPYAYGRVHYKKECIAHHFLGVIAFCKKQMEKFGVE